MFPECCNSYARDVLLGRAVCPVETGVWVDGAGGTDLAVDGEKLAASINKDISGLRRRTDIDSGDVVAVEDAAGQAELEVGVGSR